VPLTTTCNDCLEHNRSVIASRSTSLSNPTSLLISSSLVRAIQFCVVDTSVRVQLPSHPIDVAKLSHDFVAELAERESGLMKLSYRGVWRQTADQQQPWQPTSRAASDVPQQSVPTGRHHARLVDDSARDPHARCSTGSNNSPRACADLIYGSSTLRNRRYTSRL